MMSRNSAVLLMLAILVSLPPLAAADTNYIRQFAKDRPKVLFVASGPSSNILAHRLREEVLSHPENVHKRDEVAVMAAEQAATWLSKLQPKEHLSTVFLVAGKEFKQPFSPTLSALMPTEASALKGQVSFVQSKMVKPAKDGLAFSVMLYAPDGRRLSWLVDAFTGRMAANWREMPYATEFESDKIALFGQPHLDSYAAWWGDADRWNVWRDLTWYPLERRDLVLPEDLEGATEVFMIDRSKPAALPQGILPSSTDTSISISQTVTEDGRKRVVFSAPSALLLENLARRFSHLRRLPESDYRVEAVDLRSLDKALLIVPSGAIDSYPAERIYETLLYTLPRETGLSLHAPFSYGPSNEVPMSLLLGKSEEAEAFRKSLNLRYVWVYNLEAPTRELRYSTDETCQTADPGPFPQSEPSAPSRHGMSEEEYKKAVEKYEEEYARWRDDKGQWEESRKNMQVSWRRTLHRDTRVWIWGWLRLIDLTQSGKTVWETRVSGSAHRNDLIGEDRIDVQGFDHRPSSLDHPQSDGLIPSSLIIDAGAAAANDGLRKLLAEAWLPDGARRGR